MQNSLFVPEAEHDSITLLFSVKLKDNQSLRQPHVALISADLDSEAKKGLQIARNLHSRYPSIQILMLLETGIRESVIAAFRCGAGGVFLPD